MAVASEPLAPRTLTSAEVMEEATAPWALACNWMRLYAKGLSEEIYRETMKTYENFKTKSRTSLSRSGSLEENLLTSTYDRAAAQDRRLCSGVNCGHVLVAVAKHMISAEVGIPLRGQETSFKTKAVLLFVAYITINTMYTYISTKNIKEPSPQLALSAPADAGCGCRLWRVVVSCGWLLWVVGRGGVGGDYRDSIVGRR